MPLASMTDRNGKPVLGLHPNRGKWIKNIHTNKLVLRSKRAGSGLRRHLGDGITNTGVNPNELQERIATLNAKQREKSKGK